jgi:membrane-associated phospholipid phosphatase
VVIAGLVAASRALLGVHWLTDVVAGLVVGWTWFLLVAVIFGGRLQRFGEPFDEVADIAAGLEPDHAEPDHAQRDLAERELAERDLAERDGVVVSPDTRTSSNRGRHGR